LRVDVRIASAALALAALAAACSQSEGALLKTSDGRRRDKGSKPVCLNGRDLPKKLDESSTAVAVKVENDPAARPQSGLEEADVVYEEIVEGGITRFMAIFHCGDSRKVGPIRSARFDDPKIALPFTNTLAYSGANSIVQKELRKRRVMSLTEGMKGDPLFRSPAGSISVHSVFADTRVLRRYVPKKADPPSYDAFERGDLSKSAKPAKLVTLNFEAGNAIEYAYKKGLWHRWEAGSRFMAASGKQIAIPNLLVQEVRVDNSEKIVDIEGNPSPDISLEGKGRALLFRDGKVVKGEWRIKREGSPPAFVTNKGETMTFAKGPVWVELVPSRKGTVKGKIAFK
jgi:hypothetical protein